MVKGVRLNGAHTGLIVAQVGWCSSSLKVVLDARDAAWDLINGKSPSPQKFIDSFAELFAGHFGMYNGCAAKKRSMPR